MSAECLAPAVWFHECHESSSNLPCNWPKSTHGNNSPNIEASATVRRKGWLLLIGAILASLRLLVVGGVAVSWPAIEEARLRVHVRKLRGEIKYQDIEEPTASGGTRRRQVVWGIGFSHDALRKADFARLEKLPHLHQLSIDESHIDGELCQQIARLKMLRSISFGDCYLASDSLAPLTTLPRLELLFIESSRLEDEQSLAALADAPQLSHLFIDSSGLTDVGGQTLGKLSMLEHLSLDDSQVGDATLRELK
jgi:Leucine-rich repeat (LRR) protein